MNWIKKVVEHNLEHSRKFQDHNNEPDIGIFLDYYKSVFLHHQHSMPAEENFLTYDDLQRKREEAKSLNDHSYLYKWFPSDTFEDFNKNKNSENKILLQKFGWLDENDNPVEVDYKINDYGFRCKNFSNTKGIATFGCSLSFGTGLNEEDTWPYIVAKHFNTECWNLSMPGKGLDYVAMFSAMFLKDLLPNLEAICVYLPPTGRKSIIVETSEDDDFVTLQNINLDHERYLNQEAIPTFKHIEFLENNMSSHDLLVNLLWKNSNTIMNELGSVGILKSIADDYDVPFVVLNSADVNIFTEESNYARDLLHPGTVFHKAVAERMLLDLNIDK